MVKLDTQSPLISEFLKDHQQFSRLIVEILRLLESGQIDSAKQRARELDGVAGPHIAYEESEVYNRLSDLGERETTESKLVGEHERLRSALRKLLALESIDPAQLEEIVSGFRGGVKHAEHCGSLISRMSQLDPAQQTESLGRLLELRASGRKWTDA